MNADVEQILATAQLVTELFGQATDAMNLYLTVTSGYLLVAYLVGKELTWLQPLYGADTMPDFGLIGEAAWTLASSATLRQ